MKFCCKSKLCVFEDVEFYLLKGLDWLVKDGGSFFWMVGLLG